jgi:hypothetical protein
MLNLRLSILALLFIFGVSTVRGQGATVTPQQAAPFMGTWVFTMTAPEHFKGSQQTVRVWEENGRIAASVQIGKFPANNVSVFTGTETCWCSPSASMLNGRFWKTAFRSGR